MSNPISSNVKLSDGTSSQVERVLNLTQHAATPEQVAAGVVEPADKDRVQTLLTFEGIPSAGEIIKRAKALAAIAADGGADAAMIGGAPYLMAPLEWALRRRGITPLYAFSVRASEDQVMPDGSTKKVAVFRHRGFVEAVAHGIYKWNEVEAEMAAAAGWDKIDATPQALKGWDEIEA